MAAPLSEDDKLLVRRARDKLQLCEKRYTQTSSGFLNEREQDIILTEFESLEGIQAELVGGYDEAERRLMIFAPEYVDIDISESIGVIRCFFYKDYELSHRDFLGALMGLGVEREMIGDIIVNNIVHFADIVAKMEIIPFLLAEFISAGRARLTVKQIELSALDEAAPKTEVITDTVMSARIDAIVAAGFNISRESATALVKSGKVCLNRRLCEKPDTAVSDSSLVCAQGYGKFKFYITDKISKKGRTFVRIEKYV